MLPNIRFELKSDKNVKKKLIYAMISYRNRTVLHNENPNRPLKYSTGLSIEPKYWDKKKQRAKLNYVNKYDIYFNWSLDNLNKNIEDVFYELSKKGHGRPTYNQVRKALTSKTKMLFDNKSDSIISFTKRFIEIKKATNTADKYKSTIQKYSILLDQLKDYAHDISSELLFSDFDSKMYVDFFDFIDKKYLEAKGYSYSANTLNGRQKKLNAIVNKARKEGYSVIFDFQDRDLKKSADKVNHTYLTLKELSIINNLDNSKMTDSLQKSSIFFIIMATTGLRFSDLHAFVNSDINSGLLSTGEKFYYVELILKKTNE